MPTCSVADLAQHFAPLPDPRVVGRMAYPLINSVFIAICAVICGVETCTGMAVFAESKRTWLSRFLDLSAGIPSHDTFNAVLRHLDPTAFERCFLRWVQALVAVAEGQVVAIDGKTLRAPRIRRRAKRRCTWSVCGRRRTSFAWGNGRGR